MPVLTSKLPKYSKHRATGQAVVTIGGRDIYLGKHNTTASRAVYNRLVAEYLANDRRLPTVMAGLTIAEVVDRFWSHCQKYYRHPNGTPTNEVANFKPALAMLNRMYGNVPAAKLLLTYAIGRPAHVVFVGGTGVQPR